MMLLEITERMIDKSSNCTRLVEKLRQKAWVKREICANNRRQADISITTKGLSVLTKIDAAHAQNPLQKLHARLTRNEAEELNKLLDKIRG
jgi:DNA-binding MarR family transcriptional regulator